MNVTPTTRFGILRSARLSALLLCTILAASFPLAARAADPISAKIGIDKDRLYLGDSVTLRLQISGTDSPDKPDIKVLYRDFHVADGGSGPNTSEFTTIVNGRMTRVVNKSYIFVYRLTPKKVGTLQIPPLHLSAEGTRFKTAAVKIIVERPAATDDFKVQMTLSKHECYAGEPILLTVTWHRGKEAHSLNFNMPILDDSNFRFADKIPEGSSRLQRFKIPLTGGEVIGIQGSSRTKDRSYQTITFHKVLIPKHAGSFTIPAVTAISDAMKNSRRPNQPFGSFFFNARRDTYKVSSTSEELKLNVIPLPRENRPAGFSGHVGKHSISASASPTTVSVGDPITLTISVSGPENFKGVQLPPLDSQAALAADFKLPTEIAAAKMVGTKKVFTQTIRATRSDITAIPSIELPYFDTKSRTYRVARSRPIPIDVKETRIVTAIDAEGADVTAAGSALEAWSKGIAHNYAGMSLLENQRWGINYWAGSPLWLSVLAFPPIVYLAVLFSTVTVRRRIANPAALKARRARGIFLRDIHALQSDTRAEPGQADVRLLEAIRSYLGSKLKMPSAALTFAEVREPLSKHGVDHDALIGLHRIFTECEESSYAGASSSALTDTEDILQRTVDLVKRIDRTLP